MDKKIIILISSICALILVVGICFGIYQCNNTSAKFTINATLPKVNGKSAKVILLAGQSNASGCSATSYLKNNVTTEKYAEYESGYENIFINFFSTGFNMSNGFVKTSPHCGDTINHFGPEVGLAETLHESYPNETFFIIKYTWSGTDLFSQWLSPSSEGKTGDLYSRFVRYVKQSMDYIISKGYNAKIEGMCWMQGESDSFSTENATNYEVNLKNFISDVRKDLRTYAASDGITFVDALIADNPVYWVYCDLVNNSKKAVAELSTNNLLIDTNEAGLVCNQEPEDNPDMAHYDSLSEILLGNLFAEYVAQFF